MPPGALALVLLSAALHALWNFLLKRAGGTQVVMALSKVAEVTVLAPVFLVVAVPRLPPWHEALTWTAVASVGVGANYATLAHAYRHGDLSFVYPIARGAILVFLPLAAWLALGERLSPRGAAGLGAIVLGIVALNVDGVGRAARRRLARPLGSRATLFALLSGLIAAGFTIWDKRAVARMEPFAYMYLYTLIVAIGYGSWLALRVPRDEVRRAWRTWWPSIIAIGLMNMSSYLLVLLALRTGVTSYVLGMRQVSIAAGVALGWHFLREPLTVPRVGGVAMILAGCALLATATA
jgi:drug/metabolite transporter (DMT)-like permease